ncbi:hypothetical protein OB236_02400 [Paenibacillus sp. WQ 127069]|uniref:Uncharacterized protein n=1 Tax=Paenibacillus baimaensis TaxID=2982185 RepID=A0ABT2U8K9_9BACL|nr:hypothetical protein [Paenibacillus sp. WQ 127069]MCU6790970.1 hypothetical protein [Paenibacillus sp. WQ 127069]
MAKGGSKLRITIIADAISRDSGAAVDIDSHSRQVCKRVHEDARELIDSVPGLRANKGA